MRSRFERPTAPVDDASVLREMVCVRLNAYDIEALNKVIRLSGQPVSDIVREAIREHVKAALERYA